MTLTNYEVERMFNSMVRGRFRSARVDYNDFIKALLLDDIDDMNAYMNRVALSTFSYFDSGRKPSGEEPERLTISKSSSNSSAIISGDLFFRSFRQVSLIRFFNSP